MYSMNIKIYDYIPDGKCPFLSKFLIEPGICYGENEIELPIPDLAFITKKFPIGLSLFRGWNTYVDSIAHLILLST